MTRKLQWRAALALTRSTSLRALVDAVSVARAHDASAKDAAKVIEAKEVAGADAAGIDHKNGLWALYFDL